MPPKNSKADGTSALLEAHTMILREEIYIFAFPFMILSYFAPSFFGGSSTGRSGRPLQSSNDPS